MSRDHWCDVLEEYTNLQDEPCVAYPCSFTTEDNLMHIEILIQDGRLQSRYYSCKTRFSEFCDC